MVFLYLFNLWLPLRRKERLRAKSYIYRERDTSILFDLYERQCQNSVLLLDNQCWLWVNHVFMARFICSYNIIKPNRSQSQMVIKGIPIFSLSVILLLFSGMVSVSKYHYTYKPHATISFNESPWKYYAKQKTIKPAKQENSNAYEQTSERSKPKKEKRRSTRQLFCVI